jgi:hypothetical protein
MLKSAHVLGIFDAIPWMIEQGISGEKTGKPFSTTGNFPAPTPRIIPPKHEEITFAPLWAPLHNLRLQKDCLHDKPSDGGSGICA